jgi:P pilus assembly chaperone PapD
MSVRSNPSQEEQDLFRPCQVTAFALGILVWLSCAVVCQVEGKPPTAGFGIRPTYLTLRVAAGRQAMGKFTILSVGNRMIKRYAIDVYDLGQQESGAIHAVSPGRGARSCAAWISVPKEVEVTPGSRHDVSITVKCPPGARGAYYALLAVSPPAKHPEAQMAIAVRPRLGVRLEIIVPGRAQKRLDTEELAYEAGREGALPCLVLRVTNTGEWKSFVEGDVLVYDRPGQFPVRTSIPYRNNGKAFEVYPGMTLILRCPLPRLLEPGKHRIFVRLRLTDRVQARKELELEVPTSMFGMVDVTARPGEKSELDVNLSVEPSLIEAVVPPGGRRALPIRVLNNDTRAVHIRAQATQARMEPNGMLSYAEVSQSETPDWLLIFPEVFNLEPKRSTVVRTQVMIPKTSSNSLPLIGVVRLQAEAAGTEYNQDWSSGGDFAVFIVTVAPKAPRASLKTVSFNLVRLTPQHNPGAAVLRVKNTGGRIARAYGRIVLERTSGVEIAHMDIGRFQSELILPGSEREFRMPLPPLDQGKFRVRAEIAPGQEGRKSVRAEKVFTTETTTPEGRHP